MAAPHRRGSHRLHRRRERHRRLRGQPARRHWPPGQPTWTFHVSLASDVPGSATIPLIAFEAYLDQINTASGSGATLADSYATDIKVTPSSSSGG